MTDLVALLLQLAVGWTGQPMPPATPPVEILSEARMPCRCPGFFAYERRVQGYGSLTIIPERLLLREDVDLETPLGRSILLHELVHLVQAQAGPAAFGTSLWYSREREAYRLQARYLQLAGTSNAWIARRGGDSD